VNARSSPDIEPLAEGRYRVTVSYHDPVAEAVFIVGGLGGDQDPEDRRLRRDADGWWTRSYEIEGGAGLAYWFTTEERPDSTDRLVCDPLNPSRHHYPGDDELPEENGFDAALVELPGASARIRMNYGIDTAAGRGRGGKRLAERVGTPCYRLPPPCLSTNTAARTDITSSASSP
jgi:hypothetical protein